MLSDLMVGRIYRLSFIKPFIQYLLCDKSRTKGWKETPRERDVSLPSSW